MTATRTATRAASSPVKARSPLTSADRLDRQAERLLAAAANGHGSTTRNRPNRPTLADAALYGPIGDLVRAIEPHTEADPAALLFQGIIAFGNVIGRGPHYKVEGDEHHGNVFAVLVGLTASGRKGTSKGQVLRAYKLVAPDWMERVIGNGGMSSAEGLIWQVRDEITADDSDKVVVEGVQDKRLMIFEPEFSSVLKRMRQDSNTLSPIIRSAWDDGNMQSLTKRSPAKATGAHISIVGHITQAELQTHLGETESANGFGNRFLWVHVERSKILADGGDLTDEALQPIAKRIAAAVKAARNIGRLQRSPQARELWHAEYERLSTGRPGLFGSLTARAEAQVLRLSLLYALSDKATTIEVEHLKAALAAWDYCENSARYIFGDTVGNDTADKILAYLRANGDTKRGDFHSQVFQRNKGAADISKALDLLRENRLADCTVNRGTGGKPGEVWSAL